MTKDSTLFTVYFDADVAASGGSAPDAGADTNPAAPPDSSVPQEGLGAFESAQTQQQPPQPQSEPQERPEWVPDKFWVNGKVDVERMYKSYQGMEQLLGKKASAVVVPNDKSTPEEVASFRKALGVPEKAEGYDLKKPEQLPPGVEWDESTASEFSKLAHKHNIPAAALKELVAFDLQRNSKLGLAHQQVQQQMAAQRLEQGKAELKQAFGENYDARLTLVKRAVATEGTNPKSWGFGDPAVIKTIAGLAQKLSDDKLVEGSQMGISTSRDRAKQIATDKTNPYYQRYQDGDPEVVDMVRRMMSEG